MVIASVAKQSNQNGLTATRYCVTLNPFLSIPG